MRKLVPVLAAGLAALACGAPAPSGILLVTLDTTRADRLGAYGWRSARTPNLDRMAREGVLFENAVAPAPITLPSHTSILTGVPPSAHGVRDNGLYALGPDAQLVSEVLRAQGWRTGAFVGSFVLHPRFGLDQGFETYAVPTRGPGAAPGLVPERRAAAVVDDFLAWLETLAPGERFFAWVHFFDPHQPYLPPAAWRIESMHPYDQEIAYTDFQLGRLLRGLEALGRSEGLLVAVTADHGEGTGEHGEKGHGIFVYQSTLRVPLLFSGAPVAGWAGRRVAGFVSLLDLPATLLAFAGLPPDALPQASSRPLLAPGSGPARPDPTRSIYVESLLPYHSFHWRAQRGLIEDGYKLVGSGAGELYDLSADPGEQHDLAALEPERVARMGGRLRELAAPDADLGWARSRLLAPEERDLLQSLGYLAGAAGGDAFDAALPHPREHLEDLELVTAAATLLFRAGQKGPLEPGAFARHSGDAPVAGRSALRRARNLLLELRERNPCDPHVYTELGTVESLLGNADRALPLLEQAVRLRPLDPALHYHLAHAYAAAGRDEEAILAMRVAMDLDPGDPRYAAWLDERSAAPGGG